MEDVGSAGALTHVSRGRPTPPGPEWKLLMKNVFFLGLCLSRFNWRSSSGAERGVRSPQGAPAGGGGRRAGGGLLEGDSGRGGQGGTTRPGTARYGSIRPGWTG